MNINFLYSFTAALSFTVRFSVSKDGSQDYFIFHGDNSTAAHLSRQNDTIKLFLRYNSSYRHLEMSNVSNQFTFSWKGYTIDNKSMDIVRSEGSLRELKFNAYTYLSPALDFVPDLTLAYVPKVYQEHLLQCQDINYGLFVIIVFFIGILLKFDYITPRVFKGIINSYERYVGQLTDEEEPAYAEMSVNL